jgi:myo-inositol-1(or 4)-monophosphatase
MIAAAYKAGSKLLKDFKEVERLQVSKKGPGDFVSNADKNAEKIIQTELENARPDFCFLMEESGEIQGKDPENKWIVDPLDGTTNFLHGIPHFAISIAHEKRGKIIAGIIYDPIHDDMFWAADGLGAYVNNERLRVSARQKSEELLFATGRPHKAKQGFNDFNTLCLEVTNISSGIRTTGSACLNLAYVAAGRFDGFFQEGLTPWDMAAGLILIQEAGGYASAYDKKANPIYDGSILAGNELAFKILEKVIRK